MAALAGTGGSVKLGSNTVAEIGEWSLDIGLDTNEVSAFGDSWKRFITGLKGWTGSATGRFDQTDTNGQVALQNALLNGTTVSIRLYVNATNYYSGTAYITQESPKASVGGTVDVDFSFTGTGALSYT